MNKNTFEQRVITQLLFNREIGESRTAELVVNLNDTIRNLGNNNSNLSKAYSELLRKEPHYKRGTFIVFNFGRLLVKIGRWLIRKSN